MKSFKKLNVDPQRDNDAELWRVKKKEKSLEFVKKKYRKNKNFLFN